MNGATPALRAAAVARDRDEDFLNRIGGEAESLLGDRAE